MNNYTDEQLVKEYLTKKDGQALELLIKRYLNKIYGFVFSYVKDRSVADDVTQEVFVKVWKNLKKFKPSYKFKSWIFTIAKNACLDQLKKNKAIAFSELEQDGKFNFEKILAEKCAPATATDQADNFGDLIQAVGRLPEKYRATLNFYYQDGLKFREIAELCQESINTIKTRHRRALIYLRKLMGR